MGLQHGGDVHHRITGLRRRHVLKIANGLARDYGLTTPAIDFDCSNVAFKGGKNAVWLAQFLVGWSRLGLEVTLVYVMQVLVREVNKPLTNDEQKGKRNESRQQFYEQSFERIVTD